MKKYKKIYIEITNICNLNCSFCSKVEKTRKMLTTFEFKEIVEKIKDYTDYIYLHVKGEPLTHPNIIELIDIAKEYNLKVNLTTNGVLFPKYVEELSKCENLSKINFSLHSENNIPNYCEKIFDSVNKLNNQTVIYRLWTLKENELDEKSTEIVDKIKNHYKLDNLFIEKVKTENNVKINSTTYVDKDNEFSWPEINEYKSNGYCYALKTQIAILSDGTVVPCCLDSNGQIELGNIFNNTLEEIISSERYQNLKKSFQDRKPCEELCKSCTFKERFK